MSKYLLLLLFPLAATPLFAQSETAVAACLRACLQAPEMEAAFTREWGDLRPLYLRQRAVPGVGSHPVEEAINRLTSNDFKEAPWEIIPVTEEEIKHLPAEVVQFGLLDAGVGFREKQATVNLFVNLPDAPRKWLSASFLLEQEGGEWVVRQQSIGIRP